MEFSDNKQRIVNLSANIISFAISMAISFFLSPYIVKHLGAEANGYSNLAANFVSYANIVKAALNSIGSRYIIKAYHQGDFDKANKYYSSLFYGDLFLAIVFSVISFVCVWNLESWINISKELVTDVKILFALIFANFLINTVLTIFSSAPYIKNKIYLQSIRDIQSSLIRAILLVALFSFCDAKIFFVGLSALIPGLVVNIYNVYYKTRLVPELRVSKKNFSFATIKELLSQGIWNSLSSVGLMLLSSLDLLVANLFVSEADMGILSVAKSMPGVISGLASSLASVFFAEIMIAYSQNDMGKVAKIVKQSSMIIGAIVTIPNTFIIMYGSEFYSLWQPSLDSKQLQILSVLTALTYVVYAGGNNISHLFTVTLHVKENAIAIVVSGIISLGLTLTLLKFTDLGVYAIAGVSTIVSSFRIIFFNIPMTAKYIGKKKTEFAPVILRSVISTLVLCAAGYLLKLVLPSNTWLTLIISAVIFALLSLAINMFVIMDKESRQVFAEMIMNKIKKKTN